MKKLLVAMVGLSLLAGCSDGQEKATDGTLTGNSSKAELPKQNQVLKDFPEFPILDDIIDLQVYVADIETDNKGSRIIFFEDSDGNKTYKSVFVKDENYLKVIQLNDEGILYNEIL